MPSAFKHYWVGGQSYLYCSSPRPFLQERSGVPEGKQAGAFGWNTRRRPESIVARAGQHLLFQQDTTKEGGGHPVFWRSP